MLSNVDVRLYSHCEVDPFVDVEQDGKCKEHRRKCRIDASRTHMWQLDLWVILTRESNIVALV